MPEKFKFGISTTVDLTIPIEKLIKLFAQNNFDFISICAQMDHSGFTNKNEFKPVRDLINSLELPIESVHVPFGDPYNIGTCREPSRIKAVDNVNEFLEIIAMHSISTAILHPHYYLDGPKEATLNQAIRSLEDILGRIPPRISLAVENLPGRSGSWICRQILDRFDGSYLGLCYDSSHENISGEPFHLIKKYYTRIQTTHLSDNNGQVDEHLIPGDGNINWNEMRFHIERVPGLKNILFEVGTGEKLDEPYEKFIERAAKMARIYFG
jgi:sugar phosphate isomerase/epimerase